MRLVFELGCRRIVNGHASDQAGAYGVEDGDARRSRGRRSKI